MSAVSSIEWTDATWNPITGCDKVSPGCDHCYAETFAERWRGTPGHHFEQGFDVTLRPERLAEPLRWRKPRKVFVNSMSDLFHDDIPDEFIARVFDVMAATPQHTYQILTKRHGRMRSLLGSDGLPEHVMDGMNVPVWPLPNVWLGVSAEDQKRADLRIPALLETPAALRFVSAEPLLGPIELPDFVVAGAADCPCDDGADCPPNIDWIIVGGESGPGARPMHPEWARSLRDQCTAGGISFFFKQWGAWTPRRLDLPDVDVWTDGRVRWVDRAGGTHEHGGWTFNSLDDGWTQMQRTSKKAAGRELDGRTWGEMPGGAA